jgi:2-methylcitrate dehydratase PrpD
MKRKPANSYEAQFSTHFLVSTALLKGRLTLDDIEASALNNPEVLALTQLTDYAIDPKSVFPKYYDSEVVVELKDGRIVRERESINRGAVDRPLTADDIKLKFRDNAARQVSNVRAQHIEKSILEIEQGSAKDLAEILGQSNS